MKDFNVKPKMTGIAGNHDNKCNRKRNLRYVLSIRCKFCYILRRKYHTSGRENINWCIIHHNVFVCDLIEYF